MYTVAQLRLMARDHRSRAIAETRPAHQGMHLAMAAEFERDAEMAATEERRAAYRAGALRREAQNAAGAGKLAA